MTPITTNADLVAFCALLKNEPYVCVDTEFMRESTYWPILCLIQASGPNHCAVIDPMAAGLDLQPFLDLMTDETLAKVFHAARQDVEIFSNLKGLPKNLFDTQIAAMAAGYGEQIAYDALVRQILKIEIDKSSRFTDWSRRPLSDAQLDYALADVTHLAKLYPKLKDKLEKSGRLAWVSEEMAQLCDPATYDVDPEKAWRRLKPRKFNAKYLAAFRATAAWRERTAQNRDQPRSRIMKDEAIDEIATQLPLEADALNRLRSVPKGFGGSKFAPDLIEALKAALRDADAYAPVIERGPPPAQAQGAIVELLKVLLKARAEDAGVASKLISTVGDLEKLASDDKADVSALRGWRREVFGVMR